MPRPDVPLLTLDVARRMGATETVNMRTDAARLDAFTAGKGHFDLTFECSAAPSAIWRPTP